MAKKPEPTRSSPPPAKGKASAKEDPPEAAPKRNQVVPAQQASAAVMAAYDDPNASTGMENVKPENLIIPRLTILQELSPELKERKAEFIKGAELYDILDKATGEIFKDGIDFIPCSFATIYLEWAPRGSTASKAPVHNYGTDGSIMQRTRKGDKGENWLKSGNMIVPTDTWYGLNMTAGGRRSYIGMASTQRTPSGKWITRINNEFVMIGGQRRSVIYYRQWHLGVVEKENPSGVWGIWDATPDKLTAEVDTTLGVLTECKAFAQMIAAGLVQGDFSRDEDTGDNTEDGAANRASGGRM